ncbi:hypothetical protein GCM10009764_68860 [Nocardia ninae]
MLVANAATKQARTPHTLMTTSGGNLYPGAERADRTRDVRTQHIASNAAFSGGRSGSVGVDADEGQQDFGGSGGILDLG